MLNRLTAIGNLGRDPELRYTPNGKSVCNLRVAVNNGRKQPDGSWSDETLWIDVELWNESAERAAEKHHKGDRVYVEGQLFRRDYQTRDGRDGTALELRFARVLGLDRRAAVDREQVDDLAAAGAPGAQVRPRGASRQEPTLDVDDIPF